MQIECLISNNTNSYLEKQIIFYTQTFRIKQLLLSIQNHLNLKNNSKGVRKMKNAILGLFAMVTVTQAYAGLPGGNLRGRPSPGFVRVTEMSNLQVDANLEANLGGRVVAALVTIDLNGTATLSLTVNNCPPNAMCIAGPMTSNIELPIVSDIVDSCGTNIIVAEEDLRRADGNMARLTIRDNIKNTCPTAQVLMPVEVVYETANAGFRVPVIHTTSLFSGPAWLPF